MAITTYTELQTAVGNWLSRADLSSRIPEFIALCEGDINTRLRAIDQETKNTSFSINAEFVNVPSGFLAVRSINTSFGGTRYALRVGTDDQIDQFTSSGPPKLYCVVGSQLRFGPTPDATYTATLVYYTKLVGLATTTPNWLLTYHPDIYMYGSLAQAKGYIQDERMAVWTQAYLEGIERLKKHNDNNRWSGSGLQMRPG